ncbi:P-loop containing nucleoside triphosphate hydrolase protein [Cadophora sp. MPI-SDFR-AT-0126]|nr:P-loop containing nucleoside triphosphate hydrolase protein [Leotiomycetes sp. MPI-SDFR-AT-0126]
MASTTEGLTDAFTFIDRTVTSEIGPPQLFPKYSDLTSAKLSNPILQLLEDLRAKYPEYVVTYVDPGSLNLLTFAFAGNATATLDIGSDSVFRMRVWQQPVGRGKTGGLAESRGFAKYAYSWGGEDFVLYCVVVGYSNVQFVLKEIGPGESQLSHSVITDSLLAKVGLWSHKERKGIYVYDLYWRLDEALYNQVQKATWDKVILDPGMKNELTSVSGRFFDSKDVYADLGVPWKRGLIFYGPAGNGKTISIKALMHTLADRKDSIPTLYVKTAPATGHIRNVFALARVMSPCLLVLEDIDTIVTSQTRSYFFNEVDGLENNDGIMMVASTNHMDQLDPGLSKRPSRFDRKYLFPLPSKEERVQYVRFWREKLRDKKKSEKIDVEFPGKLVVPMAEIMHGFSFAYMQEAFVGSLLDIAHKHDDEDEDGHGTVEDVEAVGGGDDDLEKYELWRVMKEQVKMLRDEMDEETCPAVASKGTATPSNGGSGGSVVPGMEDINPPCHLCSQSHCCPPYSLPSSTHQTQSDAPFPPPQQQALWGRPECFAFNDWTNRLQGLSLFAQDLNL